MNPANDEDVCRFRLLVYMQVKEMAQMAGMSEWKAAEVARAAADAAEREVEKMK